MTFYIVEDHEDMRILLKRGLKKSIPGLQCVGESDTAEKALEEIPLLKPEILIVDISLPGISGIELIRRLRPVVKCMCILVVTGHDIEQYRKEAEQAGADTILSKENFPMIMEVIRKRCFAP
jgi:DNA-binding NarL/FixJ family response regulator